MKLLKLCCTVGLSLASTGAMAVDHGVRVPSLANTPVDRVTPHIYVMHGPRGLPSQANGGFMSNPAFVVTRNGVVVVDPGASARIGATLVSAIRSVTDQPVVAVFNTHIHGDHWLGNDGVRREFPDAVIYAHSNMVERRDTGEPESWQQNIHRMVGGETSGTRIVWPDRVVQDGQTLTIGGMHFRIHSPGKAHTDTDIMIEVVEEKAIFLGDVVVHRSWPAVRPQDASLSGYMAAMRAVLDLPVTTYIPGHGPTGDQRLVLEQLDLMSKLHDSVVRHYRRGETAADMTESIRRELGEFRNWQWADGLGRLVSYVYLEVEVQEFN